MEPPSSFLAAGKANAAHFQDELQQSDIPAEVLQLAFSKLEARDQTRAALVSWHFRVNVITQARSEQNALVTNFILSLTKNLNKERYAAVITALTQIWRTCPVFSSLSLMSIKENLLSVRRDVINQLKHLKDSEIKKLNEAVQEQPLPLHFQRLFDLADIYRQLDEGDLLYETRCLLAKELVDAGDLEKASEILKATPAKGMVECGQREEVYKYVLEQFGTAEKFHKAQFFFAAILDELLVRDWLNSLARKLAESGHFDEALKVAGSDRAARIMVIEQLAKARHFERAFEVAKMLGDNMPSDVCYTLATELAKADEFDLAIQLARAFPDKNESIYNPVKTVVRELGRVGQTGRALELLEPIQADYQRNQFIQEMVHGMADAGKFEEAIIANRHFRGEYSCYFGSMTL